MIVQALDPSARALEQAARHDAGGFLAGELERRELLGYPPFGHLIRVVCSAGEAGPELVGGARRAASGSSPPACPRSARRRCSGARAATGRSWSSARATGDTAIDAVRAAVEAVAAERTHGAASFAVDVDPQ